MSYYYNYYIGYEYDGKMYPLGVYDSFGMLHSVLSQSRSYACRLYEHMFPVKDSQISDELRKEFEYEDWKGAKRVDVRYLPISDLPAGDYIKKGYFLIKDVKAYEHDKDGDFDGFYDMLSPEVYAAKLQHEMMFGKNPPEKDAEGYEYTEPNASDYMYYAYPDDESVGYAAWLLGFVAGIYRYSRNIPNGANLIVLETEG